MKNLLSVFLVLIFILPAFGPWIPHDALRALHVQQESHHQDSVDHGHHGHETQKNVSHSVHFDVVTYFNDYLHVDLKNSDHSSLSASIRDTHTIDYMVVANIFPPFLSPTSGIQTTGPPPDYDWRMSLPSTPVYLATQRLRI